MYEVSVFVRSYGCERSQTIADKKAALAAFTRATKTKALLAWARVREIGKQEPVAYWVAA